MQLDRELLKQIANILSTHLGDETQRRAVLEAALFQSPTLEYIEWRGLDFIHFRRHSIKRPRDHAKHQQK